MTTSNPPAITSFPRNPLTATFTPPDDCNGIYLSTVYVVGQATTCIPPSAGLQSTQFFSPGIACPTGYVSACHDTLGVKSITTVTCCPEVAGLTLSCANTNLRGIWSTLFCTWTPPQSTDILVTLSEDSRTSSTAVSFLPGDGVNAYGVRMVYQSTDLSTTSPTTTTSDTSTTPTSLPTLSNTSHPPTNTSTPASSGLSTGAKAAVGVIVPLVALAALSALFFWWRRRQHYKVSGGTPAVELLHGGKPQRTELAADESRRGELPGDYMPVRHNDPSEPSELPANNDGR